MSNGLKIKPIPMELIVQGSPLVASALIIGQGRTEPILIIEPSNISKEIQIQELLQDLRNVVEKANSIAPNYAQISDSKIIIGSSDKPFIRAPKGTIVRKLTADLYTSEINEIYSKEFSTASIGLNGERFSAEYIKNLVQEKTRQLATITESNKLSETNNFFILGLESLKIVQLTYNLKNEL